MVYIVKEKEKLKIITVRVDQEVYFQADYAGRILVSAYSTVEALMKFNDLADHVKFPDQEESSQ